MNGAAKVLLIFVKSKIVQTFLDYNPKKAWNIWNLCCRIKQAVPLIVFQQDNTLRGVPKQILDFKGTDPFLFSTFLNLLLSHAPCLRLSRVVHGLVRWFGVAR